MQQKIKSIKELTSRVESDPGFLQRLAEDPVSTLRNETEPINDPKIFKIVLYFVGCALAFSLLVAAIITLSGPIELTDAMGKTYSEPRTVDQFFVMIGSAAIGALAGLLVPRPE